MQQEEISEIDLENLVRRYGDEMVSNTSIPLNIMKITSILALLSCTKNTISTFQQEMIKEGNMATISFSREEKNKFGRLQIIVNQIRKKSLQLTELPVLHLSPRLVVVAMMMMEKKFDPIIPAETKKNIIKKDRNEKKKKKNKGKSIPPNEVLKSSLEVDVPSTSSTEETRSISPQGRNQEVDRRISSPLFSLTSRTEVHDEIYHTTFFHQELSPYDTEGWIPVVRKKEVDIVSPKRLSAYVSTPPKNSFQNNSFSSEKEAWPQPLPQSTSLSSISLPSSSSQIIPTQCQNCNYLTNVLNEIKEKHSADLQSLRAEYETEIQNIRELHSQAIQSLQLKLFIANNNLEIEREERNKIIEEMMKKYRIEREAGRDREDRISRLVHE